MLRSECERKELRERNERLATDKEKCDEERKEAEDELAKVKEEHTAELQQATDEAASVKELCAQSKDKFKILQAKLGTALTKLAESMQANKDLKRLRASGNESLDHGQMTELQRQKAAMTTQLAEAKNGNESNREAMISLQSNVESYLATL